MGPGGDNSLVAGLPPNARAALRSHLTRISLVQRQILSKPHEPISDVLFPAGALVSIVAHGGPGKEVEIAMVGRFGMVGLPGLLGDGRAPYSAVVQLPGEADRMPATSLREIAGAHPELRRQLLRYAQAFIAESAVAGVCNCYHQAERRLARWLLTSRDRFGRAEFPLTHEFISQMLGMRRATVTGGMGKLQAAGLIRAAPGRVAVLNPAGLERLACDCYRIVSEEYRRLFGPEAR